MNNTSCVATKILYVKSSSDDSTIKIELTPPYIFPVDAERVLLTMVNMSFRYNVYNISARLGNNTFRAHITNPPSSETLTIKDGFYFIDYNSIDVKIILWEQLIRGLQNAPQFVTDNMKIEYNSTSQKLELRITSNNLTIDFRNCSFARLLGFTEALYSSALTNSMFPASRKPILTNNKNIFVNCSLSNSTFSYNGMPSNTVDSVSVKNNTEFIYNPSNPVSVDISHVCIGNVIDYIEFFLTDEEGHKIDLEESEWSAKFIFE